MSWSSAAGRNARWPPGRADAWSTRRWDGWAYAAWTAWRASSRSIALLISATSFSRALGRCYGRIWDVPRLHARQAWRWLVAALAVVASLVAARTAHSATDGLVAGAILAAVAVVVIHCATWVWIPSLLLGDHVTRRRLLPGGLLMGLAAVPLALASDLYLPRALDAAVSSFGALGVAFTYVSWLFCVAFVLVTSAVVGHSVSVDEGLLGQWLRS